MFKSIQEAKQFIQENGIRMVDFKLTDLDGRWRHLTIPAERLNEGIMEHGIGFDGSNYGYAMVDNSDMVFIPDLATGIVDPYAQIPTLAFVGDVMVIQQPHNRPFAQYPRNVARRAVAYMQETGIADEMIIGPEYEYHMFDALRYQVEPNRMGFALESGEAAWSAGDPAPNSGFHCGAHGGYHIDQPFDLNFDIRNRTCLQLAKYGIDVKYHHHEVGGAGQMEIEVELGEMTRLADDTMTIKYVIRNEAVRAGKTATLMPKPLYGQPGNGMHVHMLLKKDGEYIFYDKDGYAMLSQTAMYFIGGLLTHIRSLCGFTNPSTNSYKRLVPGFEAPVTIGFAMANRSAAIRIPAYAKEPSKKRFELRNPDATCNPYYAYAAILMAGLDGIRRKLDPKDHNWGPFDCNLFDLPKEQLASLGCLPASLPEALKALEEDHEYLLQGGVFSELLIKQWIDKKRKDAALVEQSPHPREFEQYYDL